MGQIKALKLKGKLLFLFGLITSSLLFFGAVGVVNIKAMKKSIDSVYFGSLLPVTELNTILQTYYSDLSNTIHKFKNLEISQSEASSQIEDAVLKIRVEWKNYQSHFTCDEDLVYIEYAALEIDLANRYFLTLGDEIKKENLIKIDSATQLQKNLFNINVVIQKLVKHEVETAQYERNSFLENYSAIFIQLSIALVVITVLILIIFIYIYMGISNNQIRLLIASRKLKKANKKLKDASYIDTVTNLSNRKYFDLLYIREFDRAKRERSELTFMVLNIDDFKEYSETYGMLERDEVVKFIAKVLKKILKRPTDFVFRFSDDQFGVLLTHSDRASSEKIAKDISNAVRLQEIEHKSSTTNQYITISIGVVSVQIYKDLDNNLLLSSADEMLSKAKESGGDRYMIKCDINN